MNRIDVIVKMRSRGATYQRIGDLLGITKQRVHQIYSHMYPPVKIGNQCEVCGKEATTKKSGYILCDFCESECIRLYNS